MATSCMGHGSRVWTVDRWRTKKSPLRIEKCPCVCPDSGKQFRVSRATHKNLFGNLVGSIHPSSHGPKETGCSPSITPRKTQHQPVSTSKGSVRQNIKQNATSGSCRCEITGRSDWCQPNGLSLGSSWSYSICGWTSCRPEELAWWREPRLDCPQRQRPQQQQRPAGPPWPVKWRSQWVNVSIIN